MSFWFLRDKNVLLTFLCDSNVSLTVIFGLQKHCSMRPFVLLLGRFSSFSRHFNWYILPTPFSLFFPWCTPGSASKQFPEEDPLWLWVYCIYYVSGVFFWDINTKQGRITITKPIFITSTKPRESCAVKVFLQLAKKVGCLKGQSHKGRVLQKMRDIFSMVILK